MSSILECMIFRIRILRPGNDVTAPACDLIPVIDVDETVDRGHIVQSILAASQEIGIFQLINHGIPEKLMKEVMEVSAEFFELPTEEKSKFCGGDEVDVSRMSCKLSTSLDYENEEVHFWRDVLRLLCHPIETHAQSWPHKPARYRKVNGLQVLLKDGKWVGVQPLPNALVVNIGNVLQVISNGRLKSAVHRVVTNRELARTTVVCFTNPTIDCLIEPAKALIDETHPQLYRASIYKDIRDATVADAHTGKEPLDFFKI
ncbi:2'-deoxymugineic-acid 2'-dioxygenase [Linum perenne]